ncbi:TTDN1/Protein SICKLE [Sesbania bispinosa]|nr:TTDN1/Protein SICKLE [Sesbania bispinosa]
MEDSEQRKKRLKEMRMQADLAEGSGGVGGSGVPERAMPISRLPKIVSPPPNFGGSPMAQFSSPHPGSANPQMTPPTHVSPAHYRNPVGSGPRGPGHHNFPFRPSGGGTYPSPRFDPSGGPVYNSGQGINTYPSPRFEPSGGPVYNSGQGMNTYPSPRFEPSRGPIYNSGQGINTYPSPRFEPSGGPIYNSGQGINHQPSHSPNPSPGYRNCPSPSQGRGRGFWHNTRSPVSGRGSGQRLSSQGHRSNENRGSGLDRFYKRSMVEDPWKFLKPVLWNAMEASFNTAHTPENSKPWLSKSLSTKREGSSAASVKSNSEPSLAEYLAAAVTEAATIQKMNDGS